MPQSSSQQDVLAPTFRQYISDVLRATSGVKMRALSPTDLVEPLRLSKTWFALRDKMPFRQIDLETGWSIAMLQNQYQRSGSSQQPQNVSDSTLAWKEALPNKLCGVSMWRGVPHNEDVFRRVGPPSTGYQFSRDICWIRREWFMEDVSPERRKWLLRQI